MKSLPILAAVVAALGVAAPAAAQLQLAPKSKAPVAADADHLEHVGSQCLSTYSGNVQAQQDDAHLRADVLRIYQQKVAKPGGGAGDCGNVVSAEADGSVYYVTPRQRVKGDKALYDAANGTITVTGDVVAVQDKDVMRGNRMVINVNTGDGQMEANATPSGRPGRVHTVIYPHQSEDQQSGKPQAAAAQPRR